MSTETTSPEVPKVDGLLTCTSCDGVGVFTEEYGDGPYALGPAVRYTKCRFCDGDGCAPISLMQWYDKRGRFNDPIAICLTRAYLNYSEFSADRCPRLKGLARSFGIRWRIQFPNLLGGGKQRW